MSQSVNKAHKGLELSGAVSERPFISQDQAGQLSYACRGTIRIVSVKETHEDLQTLRKILFSYRLSRIWMNVKQIYKKQLSQKGLQYK